MQLETGEFVTDQKKILNEIKKFYEKLYTTQGQVSLDYLDNIDIKQLSEVEKRLLDEPLTVEELGNALKQMQNLKSPGTDGIPCDFYKMFWPKIKDFYYQVIMEVINKGEFHLTAR